MPIWRLSQSPIKSGANCSHTKGNQRKKSQSFMRFNFFGGFSLGLVVILLLAFGILNWLNVPAGNFLDWVIGGASFLWLVVIVTVPWNIYFQAKEVVADAEQSQEKNIPIEAKQLGYVNRIAKRSLWIAIALHIISALVLYGLAATGISAVGYISSVAALLLTGLRPVIRAYEYIATRLSMIRREFKYPREDVLELRDRVFILEEQIKYISDSLDENKPDSWASNKNRQAAALRQDLSQIASSVETLRSTNQAEHDALKKEAQNAIAQLTSDGQFLDHVREIIRFFKTA